MSGPLRKATFEMSSQSTMKAPGDPFLCVAIATYGHKGGVPTNFSLCEILSSPPCAFPTNSVLKACSFPGNSSAANNAAKTKSCIINTTIFDC